MNHVAIDPGGEEYAGKPLAMSARVDEEPTFTEIHLAVELPQKVRRFDESRPSPEYTW